MQRPRIMSLLDYKIDIAPAKQSLVFAYVDAPGRIGAIGPLLGNEGVNITTLQILSLIHISDIQSEQIVFNYPDAVNLPSYRPTYKGRCV